jgi:hypothetical protein
MISAEKVLNVGRLALLQQTASVEAKKQLTSLPISKKIANHAIVALLYALKVRLERTMKAIMLFALIYFASGIVSAEAACPLFPRERAAACRCEQQGFTPGTYDFSLCFESVLQRRAAFGRALQGLGNSMMQQPAPQPRQQLNCTSQRLGNSIVTNCY